MRLVVSDISSSSSSSSFLDTKTDFDEEDFEDALCFFAPLLPEKRVKEEKEEEEETRAFGRAITIFIVVVVVVFIPALLLLLLFEEMLVCFFFWIFSFFLPFLAFCSFLVPHTSRRERAIKGERGEFSLIHALFIHL